MRTRLRFLRQQRWKGARQVIRMFRAIRRRAMRVNQVMCRVDQGHVSEGLREVAELPSSTGIIFLGEQPYIVAKGEQILKDSARFTAAASERQIVCKPEGARQERSLAGRQSIDASFSRVTAHQSIDHKFALNRRHGREDTRIVSR